MTKLERSCRDLVKAVARLEANKSPWGRRMARTVFLTVLGQARKHLDSEFPLPKVERKVRKRRKPTFLGHWEQRSHVHPSSQAGIRLIRAGLRPALDAAYKDQYWFPEWAVELAIGRASIDDIREARKSIKRRRVLLSQVRLAMQNSQDASV